MIQEASELSSNEFFLGISSQVWTVILVPITLALFKLLSAIFVYLKDRLKKKNENTIAQPVDAKLSQNQQINVVVNDAIQKALTQNANSIVFTDAVIVKNQDIRDLLISKLDAIRLDADADRAWVGKFHNGEDNQFYPSPRTMQMFTIIQDATRVGVSHKTTLLYQMPVIFFKTQMDTIKNNRYWINENTSLLQDPNKNLLQYQGVISSCCVGVLNRFQQMVGVMGVDYLKQTPITMDTITLLTNRAVFLEDHLKEYMIYSDKYIRENM